MTTTKRLTVYAAEELLGTPLSVQPHGFVRLVDYMGGDARIVQAARVSYGSGEKTPAEDEALIRYMMEHAHGTPFEKVRFEFHVKCPIFVMRQWIRHRMGSFNEFSMRYSEAKDEFWFPHPTNLRQVGGANKQGSVEGVWDDLQRRILNDSMVEANETAMAKYQYLLAQGVAREQARAVLPVSAFTEFYWTVDLRNLLGFLLLRLDAHAQREIQEYAHPLLACARAVAPVAVSAWENAQLHAVHFTSEEWYVYQSWITRVEDHFDHCEDPDADNPTDTDLASWIGGRCGHWSARKRAEFLQKARCDQ
jgi:thymidylate synthase (FAD)